MQRLRGIDLRLSSLPQDLQLCADDKPRVYQAVNAAQLRILYAKELREEGPWGSWAEIAFNVSRETPYITLPREIARLEFVDVCNRPVFIQNQFYEYLRFGNGRLPKTCGPRCNPVQVMSRNMVSTFIDLFSPPQFILVYLTDPSDAGLRVFLQGQDKNGAAVYSIDKFNRVQGTFVVLTNPFITCNIEFNFLSGIQKDVTVGPVEIWQMDPVTGAQVKLLTMEPSETTAWYRRYYLDALPINCCNNDPNSGSTVQVTAIAKLDFVPVTADTDYCLIQNQEAIIEEAQAWRYSKIDKVEAKQMAQEKHIQAIRLIMGELTHYLGMDELAVNFKPFGSATLQRQGIGRLM